MGTIRFDRIELKYLVDGAQRRAITAGLQNVVPDRHADEDGRYPITSIYYDGPEFSVYLDRLRGVPSRRKLRVRVYGSSETAAQPVSFLEIKHKYDGRIGKRRAQLSVADALRVGDGHQPEGPVDATQRLVIQEAHRMIKAYGLRPTCGVRYVRQAFQGQGRHADLRVTFDDELGCRAHDLIPRADDLDFPVPILDPDLSVLEIKVDSFAPKWLADLVAASKTVRLPFSKYSLAVEALGLVHKSAAVSFSTISAPRHSALETSIGSHS